MGMDMILPNLWNVIPEARKLFSWAEGEIARHCLSLITFLAMSTGKSADSMVLQNFQISGDVRLIMIIHDDFIGKCWTNFAS